VCGKGCRPAEPEVKKASRKRKGPRLQRREKAEKSGRKEKK
jgi:hypothetical protein